MREGVIQKREGKREEKDKEGKELHSTLTSGKSCPCISGGISGSDSAHQRRRPRWHSV